MKKWKVVLGIVLVFLLGTATGALITHRVYQRTIRSVTEDGPTGVRSMLVKMMTRRLDLTPAQQVEVDDAVREAQRDFQVIRKEVQPRAELILDRAAERIRKQLDVKQREKFDRLVELQRQRWRAQPRP